MTAARRLVAGAALAALVGGGFPHAALAGALGGGAGLAVSPWRVIGALLLCLALGAGAILLLRRHFGLGRAGSLGRPLGGLLRAPADRRIRVIEQQGLGPQRSLSLIEIDRRTYAALIAPGSATLVALDDPAAEPIEGAA